MTPTPSMKKRSCLAKQSPATQRPSVEQILRDAAFVLQMTRRVKDAILNNRPLSPAPRG